MTIHAFAKLIEEQQIARLKEQGLGCEANLKLAITTVKAGTKFAKVDIGYSGRYMVEMSTGNIFGIKAYGQVHRGHFYGTLDTTADWYWGDYYPKPKHGRQAINSNGIPTLTYAPTPAESGPAPH